MSNIRRIHRVYYDLPNYIKPVEVIKIFKLMNQRNELNIKINGSRKTKDADVVKLAEINADLALVLEVISPNGLTYLVSEHRSNGKNFWVLTLYSLVTESLFDKGQDND